MTRFILPIILIAIAISGFFVFTNPIYTKIDDLRTQVASYNEALSNSKALENERDKLTVKYNTESPDNLDKIKKLLPENIDNIRLILEIEKIATPYGMTLKNVKYDTADTATTTTPATGTPSGGLPTAVVSKDYGVWHLAFSTGGTYNNFINFTRDLESNLRVVDIESVAFSSDSTVRANPALPEVYQYDFKIKTYWLKN